MTRRDHRRSLSTMLGIFAAAAIASCGSSSNTAPSGSGFTVDGVVGDAPIDDLVAFSATVDEVRLVTAGGQATVDLLGADVSVEFLGLQTSGAWLFQSTPPQGTYTAVRLVLVPGSTTARSLTGAMVAVTEVATTFDVALVPPLVVGDDGYRQLVMDLNLADSLSGDTASPPISFDPAGSALSVTGAATLSIDEVKGIVISSDESAGTVEIDAFVDDDLAISLGRIRVTVPAGATLIQEDDSMFATPALFFAALTMGSTLLEVHGDLGANSTITTTRIEIEDQNGGVNSANVVKIEGRITAITPGTSFDMILVEIEKGSSVADPVLIGLGNPATITVAFDGTTTFIDESHLPTTSAALAIGEKVDVKFNTFATSPFLAAFVEVDGAPSHSAFVQDVSGAPTSIVIRLRPNETGITAGLVVDSATDVTVDLTGAQVTLKVDDDPTYDPALLVPGVRVKVEGPIAGTPAAPTIVAARLEARPGRFRGNVTGINAGLSTFNSTVSSENDPFGSNVTTPPYTVVIDSTCTFEDDAASESAFFALFNGLQAGETLEVRVKGIGTGVANELRAYEVRARVQ